MLPGLIGESNAREAETMWVNPPFPVRASETKRDSLECFAQSEEVKSQSLVNVNGELGKFSAS
jgi:hypothetical protein